MKTSNIDQLPNSAVALDKCDARRFRSEYPVDSYYTLWNVERGENAGAVI